MSPTDKAPRGRTADAAATLTRERPRGPFIVGFHLIEGFPMMAFASAIEPLRAANRLSGEPLFDWRLISNDGTPVRASNGIDIDVHNAIGDAVPLDMLLVCAGMPDAGRGNSALFKWLRGLSRGGVLLGGISLGAYALAYAGLLDGRRCALHWESLRAFGERFPRIHTTSEIFVMDANRWSCSGGTAALDMMLELITSRHGRALATDVSEQFIHPRIRGTQDPQRMAIQSRLGVANKKLIAAIGLMEEANDDPRPVQDIAAEVDLSPRQLERLFAKYLQQTPSRYYLELRLERARSLLLETTKPILDVAVACGFASASHFSRCYRAVYGHKPSEERVVALSKTTPRGPGAGRRSSPGLA